jgi:dipeptidyl aminopeptidase/acylaminoacyl peptidase
MKIKHENIELIENWFDSNNLELTFSKDIIRRIYDDVFEDNFKINNISSMKRRIYMYNIQYEFIRRDILKLIYKRNNYSAQGISEGFVYAIGNPSWPDYVKIGSSSDVIDRLNSYQTSSPLRDYYIIDFFFSHNKLKDETELHEMFDDRNSEWCKTSVDEVKRIFKRNKEINAVGLTPDKIIAGKTKYFTDPDILNIKGDIRAIIRLIRILKVEFVDPKDYDKESAKRNWKTLNKLDDVTSFINEEVGVIAKITKHNNIKQKIELEKIK